MRKPHSYLLASLAAFAAVASLFASPITSDQARTAATQFVASDPIGSAVLKGRSVQDILDLDGLWVATLSPSGHVIFSGSDLVEPIVGFSPENFASPDPDSPASDMLAGARRTSRAAEESGVGSRNAKWAKFLAAKTRLPLHAASVDAVDVSQDAVIIPPFLQSHYNQWQPYNDFCPVYDASDNGYYRGRSPCGCVATATAQVLRHFRWPSRIDKTIRCSHSFTNEIQTTFPILFNGYTPINWDGLVDDYIYYTPATRETDLRGTVAESERYPVARLILLADVMAQMSFGVFGSSADFESVASSASDWYTQCQKVDLQENAILVRTEIECGVPCYISVGKYENNVRVGGHAVIAHGWAEYGDTQYVYINFGYGGQNDGYYNIAEDFQEYSEKEAYVGFYPRAKPQLEPLPKVCGRNITLNWDFPDFYNNNLSGFTVAVSKLATTPTTFLDDFSDSRGASSSEGIFVGYDSKYSYDGNLLYAASNTVGTYTFPNSYTLTSASVLTFKMLSYFSNWQTFEIQASFNDGEWVTIAAPTLNMGWDGGDGYWYCSPASWSTERVYLGAHGGETVRFRILKGTTSTNYIGGGLVLLDDFKVTDVLEYEQVDTRDVTEFERSCILPQLDEGVAYSFTVTPAFTVTPVISDARVDGESSDPVSTIVAGAHSTPIPGVQTYHTETLSFSTLDTSGTWSYLGNPVFVDGICDDWCDDSSAYMINDEVRRGPACKVIATLKASETLTEDSMAYFAWRCSGYQNPTYEYNIITTTFIDEEGVVTEVERLETHEQTTTGPRYNSVPLGMFAGHSGRIEIKLVHRPVFTDYTPGQCMLEGAQILNVRAPSTPTVQWRVDTVSDLGTPAILSVSNVVDDVAVSPVREDFFSECKYGEITYFDVECSGNVVNLNAYSSHLALVGERQTTVRRIGGSTFRVAVDASNIGADRSRSRLILTLEAIDGNGTKAYKDLSLRFSEEGEAPPVDPLEIVTSVLPPATSGVPYAVSLEAIGGVAPYAWSAGYELGYYEFNSRNSFDEIGEAQDWNDQDGNWEVQLPFEFPFYDLKYSNVWVNANGMLSFGGPCNVWYPKEPTLINNRMIAVLGWRLDLSCGNIYLDKSSPGAITVRWKGIYYDANHLVNYPLSYSATLYEDGRIRLSYGAGNILGGLVGISSGNGIDYILSPKSYTGDVYDSAYSLNNAQDIVFEPQMPLTSWLLLSDAGVLSGTPTASGESAFTVFITDGAGTRISKTLNLSVVSLAPVVTPGENTQPKYTSTEAEAAVAEINGNKANYIATPEVLGDASAEVKAEYKNMFEAKTEYVSTADKYRIITELTTAAEETLANTASNAVETVAEALGEIAEAAAGDQTEVSVTGAQPGFYYSISYGVEPDALSEGVRVQAPASGNVTLKTPPKSSEVTDRGFYRVNVNVRGW